MHQHGKIVVIKRNGSDGANFPLTAEFCLFGRGLDSDIRIQLPSVDNEQCQIEVDDKGQ
ncbi:antigen KI-67, partial [Elysia marginata]